MATAHERYALLEAAGTWFDGQSARPFEVIVRFGEATLTLYDADTVPLAHWALASLRALQDVSGRDTLVLVPDQESDERLTLTDPEMIAAIRDVCPNLHRRRAARGTARRLILWGGGAVGSVLLIVFVLIPLLADQLATLIPPRQEEALGRQVVAQSELLFRRFSGGSLECSNAEGVQALDHMAARLRPHFSSHVPIKLRVFDVGMINAFAAPGGYIVIFRGLIEKAEGPEEVAGVLAHEIGHVIHRDPTRLSLRAAGSSGILGLLLGDILGGAAITVAADAIVSAQYSRDAESNADEAAHQILSDAELPMEPLARFFERLAKMGGKRPALLSHLATHPDLGARAEAARKADIIQGTRFVPVLDDNDWVALRGICEK